MRVVQNKYARLQVHSTVVVLCTVFAGCIGRRAWRRVVRRQYLFVEASIELRQLRVGCAKSIHAAAWYSWMSPPRRSRRSMLLEGGGGASMFAAGAGGLRFSARWGLCVL
jgi:hypothetical protein